MFRALARSRPLLFLAVLALAVLAIAGRAGVVAKAGARSHPTHPTHSHRPKAGRPRPTASLEAAPGEHWLATWGASMQPPTTANPTSEAGFANVTIREVVFSSIAGSEVRVRVSNAFGTTPLEIGRAAVATAGAFGSLIPGSVRQLTFNGQTSALIAPGAEMLSDPVALVVRPLSRLSVSLYLPRATGPATGHGGSRETNYLATGAHVLDQNAAAFSSRIGGWYFLDGVDLMATARYRGALVALGDSITAGVGSSLNADASWPDELARRLATLPGPTLSVVDEGIGGNRVLNGSPCCGQDALDRFDDDVLGQTGVRDVILLEGINDIGYAHQTNPLTAPHTLVSAGQLIAGYQQLIARAHAAGLRIFGATLLPFKGAHYWTPAGQLVHDTVNHWILTSGAFNGVVNFAATMADPSDPQRLNPAYDSGDHLHPNDAGYRAMANAVEVPALLG